MITVDRTFDYELVKRIVTHPDVYPLISDDNSPAPEDWEPIQNDGIFYILISRDSEPIGVITLIPQNSVCYEGHTCLLPEFNGNGAEAGRLVQRWMFENTRCQRIVGNVPAFNPRALAYVQKTGMRVFGVNQKSFLKDGVLYDQTLLGVSKEDVCH